MENPSRAVMSGTRALLLRAWLDKKTVNFPYHLIIKSLTLYKDKRALWIVKIVFFFFRSRFTNFI